MSKVNRFALAVKRGKQALKKPLKRQPQSDPIGLAVRMPLYSAAGGLLIVYGWGAMKAFPLAMGGALCAVFAMSELLKPKLGELAAEALTAKDRLGTMLMLGSSVACIALGALGGVIAMGAANGPRDVYDAAMDRVEQTQRRLEQAQEQLDALPTCTPAMPASRCREQTEQNRSIRADRANSRDVARDESDAAKRALEQLPNPGPGMPHVPLWLKALVIGAIEFVLFAVPFAVRRRVEFEARKARQVKEPDKEAPLTLAEVVPLKINDGGWERRRELYGPSGRRRRLAG